MRETKFIDQKAEKWKRYEEGLNSGDLGPDELERAFIELNDDLAYARTFYKNRSVRVFLNNLLTPFYDRIYRGRPRSIRRVGVFFTETAPRIHFQARRFMLVSFVAVLLGFLMGYFGTRHDNEFATTVLGNQYVQMTEENIAKGDPMGVYKDAEPGEMFFRITTNNLQVAFYFFIFGALFCIGTLYMLTINGIVLGAFTYMFTSRGLTTEYLLTVYQHGTLEILTMVIEGAAGIMMGAGFLFPGTLSRIQAVQNAARKSITMFLVCVPIIILAAFIESYLTRFTEIAAGLRALIIFLSLLFILYYFIVMPWLRYRGNQDFDLQEDNPRASDEKSFEKGDMYTLGELLIRSIGVLRQRFTLWVVTGLALGLGIWWLSGFLGNHAIDNDIRFQLKSWLTRMTDGSVQNLIEAIYGSLKLILWNIYCCRYLFHSAVFAELFVTSWILWSVLFVVLYRQNTPLFQGVRNHYSIWYQAPLLGLFPAVALYIAGDAWWFFLWIIWPAMVQALGIGMAYRSGSLSGGLQASFNLVFSQLVRFVAGIVVFVLLYLLLMLGSWILVSVVLSFTANMHQIEMISPGILRFYVVLNYVMWPVIILAGSQFFLFNGLTMYEKQTGTSLFRKVDEIGFRKEVYGVETE